MLHLWKQDTGQHSSPDLETLVFSERLDISNSVVEESEDTKNIKVHLNKN